MARPARAPSYALTDDEVQALNDQGFVVIRDALAPEVLEPVRNLLSAVVDEIAGEWERDGLLRNRHDEAPFETRWALLREQVPAANPVVWRRILASRTIYDLWQRPELLDRVRHLIGGADIWAHDVWSARPREPNADVQTIPWHQDAHHFRSWQVGDGRILTYWIPLVPATTTSGCLQLLPGWHRRGLIQPEADERRLWRVPVSAGDEAAAVTAEMEPGDVLLFSDLTVHRSLPNRSNFVRWSIDIRFAEATAPIREKAPGGYLCWRGDGGSAEPYDAWARKYLEPTGLLRKDFRRRKLLARLQDPRLARDHTAF